MTCIKIIAQGKGVNTDKFLKPRMPGERKEVVQVRIACDYCGKVLGDKRYSLTVDEGYKHRAYYCCSEECFKKVLIMEGIGIPEVPRSKRKRGIPKPDREDIFRIVMTSIAIVSAITYIVLLLFRLQQ